MSMKSTWQNPSQKPNMYYRSVIQKRHDVRLRFPNGHGHLGALQRVQTDGRRSQYFSPDFLALGVFYEIEDTKGSDLQKRLVTPNNAFRGVRRGHGMAGQAFELVRSFPDN